MDTCTKVCEFDNLVIVNVVPSVLRDNIVTISADFQQGTESVS